MVVRVERAFMRPGKTTGHGHFSGPGGRHFVVLQFEWQSERKTGTTTSTSIVFRPPRRRAQQYMS
ncbi:hypothetical protein Dda_2742 [Drechslerella dactyloides]|uniref:Uncharacterized protein n=1 Tax=Drechslerella dactyloides TaxID=74499 RepID=A0AAD6J022_DREDA|nr:hypothetical protein Dda_2742 [Drechslerella dactyloides]